MKGAVGARKNSQVVPIQVNYSRGNSPVVMLLLILYGAPKADRCLQASKLENLELLLGKAQSVLFLQSGFKKR